MTVTASNQAASNQAASNGGEVGSERSVKAAAPSAGLKGSDAASARRPAIMAVCGLVFVILIEAAWAGLLCFVVLRLIVR